MAPPSDHGLMPRTRPARGGRAGRTPPLVSVDCIAAGSPRATGCLAYRSGPYASTLSAVAGLAGQACSASMVADPVALLSRYGSAAGQAAVLTGTLTQWPETWCQTPLGGWPSESAGITDHQPPLPSRTAPGRK